MPDKPRTGFLDWILRRKSQQPKSQPNVTVGVSSDEWLEWMLDELDEKDRRKKRIEGVSDAG